MLTPARTIARPGARGVLADWARGQGGRALILHGRSAWFGPELALTLGDAALAVQAPGGEPDLPRLRALLGDLRPRGIGAVVAIGGGAVIDLGKALAALLPNAGEPQDYLEVVGQGRTLSHPPLPFAAVPTTAGTGAEATKNAVIAVPEHAVKVSLRDDRMIPALAVLDPDLTRDAPWTITLACGMDAITQLIEPFLSSRARPETDRLARAAIGPALAALHRLADGEDAGARDTMLRAAHLSGIALANAGLGAVHGLAGAIGGQSGAAHGALCARLLPATLRVNRRAVAAAGQDVARFDALDAMVSAGLGRSGDAAGVIEAFIDAAGLPGLSALTGGGVDGAATIAATLASSSMKANPVPLSGPELGEILALSG